MRTATLALALLAFASTAIADGKSLLWKPATKAFLHVNDAPPKEWDAFQIEDKTDRFLVQIGKRYLLVDDQAKQVFEVNPAAIERSGSDVLWDPDARPEKPLATSQWIVRDVGEALRIVVRLDAEDHTLDLQIPHPPSRY
jgi:hypothetical protein